MFYSAGGILLAIAVLRLAWRGMHRGMDVPPVSDQWLAERRGKRPPD